MDGHDNQNGNVSGTPSWLPPEPLNWMGHPRAAKQLEIEYIAYEAAAAKLVADKKTAPDRANLSGGA